MAIPTTPVSLLSRCRDTADQEAWRELDKRYRDLLIRYCRRRGLCLMEAEDAAQRVFIGLTRTLPAFAYDPDRGRFRDYLFRATRNAMSLSLRRRKAGVGGVSLNGTDGVIDAALPASDELRIWEEEWVAHHYRRALAVVRCDCEPQSIAVFERSLAGASVADLQAEFALSEQAIYKIRYRIRARLKELIRDQIVEEDRFDDRSGG